MEVTPGMIVHIPNSARCMCDDCHQARVKQVLPQVLRNTIHIRSRGVLGKKRPVLAVTPPDETVGSKPRPRFEARMNMPVRAIAWAHWMFDK